MAAIITNKRKETATPTAPPPKEKKGPGGAAASIVNDNHDPYVAPGDRKSANHDAPIDITGDAKLHDQMYRTNMAVAAARVASSNDDADNDGQVPMAAADGVKPKLADITATWPPERGCAIYDYTKAISSTIKRVAKVMMR